MYPLSCLALYLEPPEEQRPELAPASSGDTHGMSSMTGLHRRTYSITPRHCTWDH